MAFKIQSAELSNFILAFVDHLAARSNLHVNFSFLKRLRCSSLCILPVRTTSGVKNKALKVPVNNTHMINIVSGIFIFASQN